MLVLSKRSRKIARMGPPSPIMGESPGDPSESPGDPRADDFAARSADAELTNSFRIMINKPFLDLAMRFMKVQVTKPFMYIIHSGVYF